MHTKSKYGTLFFVPSAVEKRDIPVLRTFTTVVGDGELSLQLQQGYCFVINHYDLQLGYLNRSRYYRANITKQFAQDKPLSTPVRYMFIPTTEPVSVQIDDLCVSHMSDVIEVGIEFRLDNSVVQNIRFKR
jgi:hypothetical protein